MQLFEDVESDLYQTFDPNTRNKKVKIQAMLDVGFLHEASEEEISEEIEQFISDLKSQTEPT